VRDPSVLEKEVGSLLTGTNGKGSLAPAPPPQRTIPHRLLGELLVSTGRITQEQLTDALLQQPATGKRLGALLIDLGMVTERGVIECLALQMGVPYADLRNVDPEPEAIARIPEELARRAGAIPLRVVEGRLEVAVADPMNTAVTAELLRAVAPQPVTLVIASAEDIDRAINNKYRAMSVVEALVGAFQAAETLQEAESETRVVSDDAPIVHLVDVIVTQGVRDRASDIHIEPQTDGLRIRFRIDGALHEILRLPVAMGPAVVSRIKILANMSIFERRRPQDGQMVKDVDGRPLDVRIATSPTLWGEKVVLRLLDRTRAHLPLEDLGMPPVVYERFMKALRTPYGMVICAGPTGSGKTTTLYGMLGQMNQSERNISTIEDPVEYIFSSINQIQINEQTGVTFAGGLRAILRQDPDVILVGEIRDAETARIAVESALTGHFVLSSIHAIDACSAMQRFVEMGIEPFLIASTVNAVVSQRLLRRICTQCREPYEPPFEELAYFADAGGSEPAGGFTRGHGCNFCSRTGFSERIGVFELVVMSREIKKHLMEGAPADVLREVAVQEGTLTLRDGGVALVEAGITTIGEVLSSIYVL
jgi:type IV pilus assembly protein PilB